MSYRDPANIIQIENVDKFFGTFQALKNISLSVKKGDFLIKGRTRRRLRPVRVR